jgi:hypothetical protein
MEETDTEGRTVKVEAGRKEGEYDEKEEKRDEWEKEK